MPRERRKETNSRAREGRPHDLDSYRRWLKESFEIEVGEKLESRFEAVVNKVKRDFEASTFWSGVCEGLNDYDSAYRLDAQNYPLFLAGSNAPQLVTKSFSSFILKTFRRNVAENLQWPEPPSEGWVLPDAGFSKINDLVRTSFIVKYLDGVEFLAEQLKSRSEASDCRCTVDFEARMEGHYAAHLSVHETFQIPGENWEIEAADIAIEIQIITQLQEVIRRLTHKFYEARRQQPIQARSNWQWDYKSDEFTTNYLGHILHYVEGMIMDVRTRQNEKEADGWSALS